MPAGQRLAISTLESFSSDYRGERNERSTPNSQFKKVNKRVIKEYLAQSSSTLQSYILHTRSFVNPSRPFCDTIFASVLLADISGFTALASRLQVEELKHHINNFFDILLGNIITEHGGDVVKFCGDAVLVMWSVPLDASPYLRSSCASRATQCALDLLKHCGHYNSGSGDSAVSLRLHCGMSVGPIHCMTLGNSNRMEFVISGSLLAEMGLAESEAQTGEICISQAAFDLVRDDFVGEIMPKGSVRITCAVYEIEDFSVRGDRRRPSLAGALCSCWGSSSSDRHKVVPMTSASNDECDITPQLYALTDKINRKESSSRRNPDPKADSSAVGLLGAYVHQSARDSILSDTSQHLAELRMVTTMFIQLLNLDDDFNFGRIERPQLAIGEILETLQQLGGALRQYVVDDKGCCIIATFGTPSFSSTNDSIRAVSAALNILARLAKLDILCRIGVAQGKVYCGYIGSSYRKEYAVMGSSVNLAARLMGKAAQSQILVDSAVFVNSQDEFEFEILAKVEAKGYTSLVQVYSPSGRKHHTNDLTEEVKRLSTVIKHTELVGRDHEVSFISESVINSLSDGSQKEARRATLRTILSRAIAPTNSIRHISTHNENKFVIIGGPGYGKTALINEVVRLNSELLSNLVKVNCQCADMQDSYEVVRQLLSSMALLLTSYSPVGKTASSNIDMCQSFSSESEDMDFDIFDEDNRDAVTLRKREDLYQTLASWVETNLYDVKFEYIGKEHVWHGSTSGSASYDMTNSPGKPRELSGLGQGSAAVAPAPAPGMGIQFMTLSARGSAMYMRRGSSISVMRRGSSSSVLSYFNQDGKSVTKSQQPQYSRIVSASTDTDTASCQHVAISAHAKVYTLTEVLPLLRLCLGTLIRPSTELLLCFSDGGLEDMTCIVAAEILRNLVCSVSSGCLVVEDMQWCDKLSFAIIMKTVENMDSGVFIGSMRPSEGKGGTLSSQLKYMRSASFEGSTEANTVDEISSLCQIVSLAPFTRNNVKTLIEVMLGENLIKSAPHVISDDNISIILRKSSTVPGDVVETVRQLREAVSSALYGVIATDTGESGTLQQYDTLPKDHQIVLKMASVCGTNFSVDLVAIALDSMGYVDIAEQVEGILESAEKKNIIKRVFAKVTTKEVGGKVVRMSLMSRSTVGSTSTADAGINGNNAQDAAKAGAITGEVVSGVLSSDSQDMSSAVVGVGPTSSKSAAAVFSTKHSIRSSRISEKSASLQQQQQLLLYTFLDKKFREGVYKLMLETQRQAVHLVIAESLEEMFGTTTTLQADQAECLAFHYSRANELEKNIQYSITAARLFRNKYMPMTSLGLFTRVAMLCTDQREILHVIQNCYPQSGRGAERTRNGIYGNFVKACRRNEEFGSALVGKRYLEACHFQKPVTSECSLISNDMYSGLIGELSVMHYSLGEFCLSNNFSLLALHIRGLKEASGEGIIKCISSRDEQLVIAEMMFFQAEIKLQRGLIVEAIKALTISSQIVGNPPKDKHEETEKLAQQFGVMATLTLFTSGRKQAEKLIAKAKQVGFFDRTRLAYSYYKFHSGIVLGACGNFQEALSNISAAATNALMMKHITPLTGQVEVTICWLHLFSGHGHLMKEKVRSVTDIVNVGDDTSLRNIWFLEILAFESILEGKFFEAKLALTRLKKGQRGHHGVCFYHALAGCVGVFEKRFMCGDSDGDALECINSLSFAMRKLVHRIQTSPIGVMCLFLSAYASLFFLQCKAKWLSPGKGGQGLVNKMASAESTKKMQWLSAGLAHRLDQGVQDCIQSLKQLSKSFPFLALLVETLLMKQAHLADISRGHNRHIHPDRIKKLTGSNGYYTQFSLGYLFWNIERKALCKLLADGDWSVGTEALVEKKCDLESCVQKFNIPDHHPLITSRVGSDTNEGSPPLAFPICA